MGDADTPLLRIGSTGPFVTEAQTRLAALGRSRLPPLEIDGVHGAITDIYVRARQRAMRDSDGQTVVNGEVTAELLDNLRAASGGVSASAAPGATAPATDASWRTRVQSAGELDAVIRSITGEDFVTWFARRHAGQGAWRGLTLSPNDETRARVALIFDRVPPLFERGPLSVATLLTLFAIVVHETGGTLTPLSERMGRRGHPGLAYAFDSIAELGKASYNREPDNASVFTLLNRSSFVDAHRHLPLADALVGTADEVWKGSRFPQDRFPTSLEPTVSGILRETDFFKFRGRGLIQTTWRANYRPLIEYVQAYQGTQPVLAHYANHWRGLPVDVVADQSTNADWDTLFQQTEHEIALIAIRTHENGRGRYLDLADDDRIRSRERGSVWFAAKRVNGGDAYADRMREKVLQLLDALEGGGAIRAGGATGDTPTIELQQLLAAAVAPELGPIGTDGVFGSLTDLWVRVFQHSLRASGLSASIDGEVGPTTWAALRAATPDL